MTPTQLSPCCSAPISLINGYSGYQFKRCDKCGYSIETTTHNTIHVDTEPAYTLDHLLGMKKMLDEHPMTDFSRALFEYVRSEIERVYGNRYQKQWDGNSDPEIPGITWNPYDWHYEEYPEPNFSFGEIEIRWYKYPGRGMTCNVQWTASEWARWFYKALETVREADKIDD